MHIPKSFTSHDVVALYRRFLRLAKSFQYGKSINYMERYNLTLDNSIPPSLSSALCHQLTYDAVPSNPFFSNYMLRSLAATRIRRTVRRSFRVVPQIRAEHDPRDIASGNKGMLLPHIFDTPSISPQAMYAAGTRTLYFLEKAAGMRPHVGFRPDPRCWPHSAPPPGVPPSTATATTSTPSSSTHAQPTLFSSLPSYIPLSPSDNSLAALPHETRHILAHINAIFRQHSTTILLPEQKAYILAHPNALPPSVKLHLNQFVISRDHSIELSTLRSLLFSLETTRHNVRPYSLGTFSQVKGQSRQWRSQIIMDLQILLI